MYSRSIKSFAAGLLKPRKKGPAGLRYLHCLIVAAALLSQPAFAIQKCHSGNTISSYGVCGDGTCNPGEACDDGGLISDAAPNACRSDCRIFYCGDGVKDSNEQCDEGGSNSNSNPNRCRTNCTPPRCGDGVADTAAPYNEQCDDANASNEDGCLSSCRACVMLGAVGNIEINDDTQLCAGEVKLDDYGDYGTVIIKRSGITLDCNGLKLTGEGRGVGIMIFRSNNVTIRNCEIYGYDTGIKGEDSNNITLINNRLCNNSVADIELPGATQMVGNSNACKKPGNWNDSGKSGCSQQIALCVPPVSANQQAMVGIPAMQSLQNMPQVTVQPRTPSRPAAPGGLPVQRVPTKAVVAPRAPSPAPLRAVPAAPALKAQAAPLPDLAISRLAYSRDCRPILRIENKGGGVLTQDIYLRDGVYLQRIEDGRVTRRTPLARIDSKKALLTGRGIGWTDTYPVTARRELKYQLIDVGPDADNGNNEAGVAVPASCQRRN